MGKYDGLVRYNKLIRDRVPEAIEDANARCKTHVVGTMNIERNSWRNSKKKLENF